MKVLLDTCTLIWTIAQPDELSKAAKNTLLNPSSEILVSPMSCAEIACLVERKKLVLNQHWKIWFRKYVELNHWESISVDLPIIEEAYSLPGDFHKDPVDRILVATARLHQATILTADQKILDYPHVDSKW